MSGADSTDATNGSEHLKGGWPAKFGHAFRGLVVSIKQQNSFWVHIPVATAVLALAGILQVESWQWVSLVFAIALVIAAELMNTAVEQIVKVVHPDHDTRIGQALDAAAASVLVTSVVAVAIGLIIFLPPLWRLIVN